MVVIKVHERAPGHDCPRCGPHSATVAEVLAVQADEDVLALWEALRWKPHVTPAGAIVLVDVQERRGVAEWKVEAAKEFLEDVLLPGPYGAELVLEVDSGEVELRCGQLVGLAAGLSAVVEVCSWSSATEA